MPVTFKDMFAIVQPQFFIMSEAIVATALLEITCEITACVVFMPAGVILVEAMIINGLLLDY